MDLDEATVAEIMSTKKFIQATPVLDPRGAYYKGRSAHSSNEAPAMIDCERFRHALAVGMPEVVSCDPANGGAELRLRTLFEHPDGDLIDIFIVDEGGSTWLTDHGEAIRHLDVLGFDPLNTPRKRALLQDALSGLAVQNSGGTLMVAVNTEDPKDLTTKIVRMGQAMTRVGDMLFVAREQTPRFFRDDVNEFLRERQVDIEENPELVGRSGQPYTLDFRIRRRTSPLVVKTLTTGSRAAAETLVNGAVRMLFDVSRSGIEGTCVSVIDDSEDVWTEPQLSILSSFGELVLWSAPDRLVDLARSA